MKPSVSWKILLVAVTLILFLKRLGALVITGGSDGVFPEKLGILVFLSLFVLSGVLLLSSAAALLFWTLGYLFGAERELHSGRWTRLSDEPKIYSDSSPASCAWVGAIHDNCNGL
jgi:hypothetical protein